MKQLLVGIAVGVLIFTLAVFLFNSARLRALADADRELATNARLISDSVDRLLQIRMVETFTFAALPSLRGFLASDETTRSSRMAVAQSELQSIVEADPLIAAASIVDVKGGVIATTDESMYADWSRREFVQEGMRGHLFASGPARDFGDVFQFYSAPVLDNAGSVAGVLVVRVNGQELWSVVNSVENVIVVDENSVRIADSSTAPQIFAAIAPLSNDAMARALANKRYGEELSQIIVAPLPSLASQLKNSSASISFTDSGGARMRAAVRTIGTNSWSVIVMKREDILFSSSSAMLWQAFGLGVAVTLVIGSVVFFVWRGAPQKPHDAS